MNIQRFLVALTLVNVMLLIFLLAETRSAMAQTVAPVLRGRALEIVDDQGRVRATLSVLPADPDVIATDGKAFPETVVLRLIDPKYGPVVKIAGSARGAGIGLGGDSEAKYALIEATPSGSFVTLTDPDGRQQRLKP